MSGESSKSIATTWIAQDPNNLQIVYDPIEWQIINEYIAKSPDVQGLKHPLKITRKQLEHFCNSHPNDKFNTRAINHSFVILPEESDDDYKICMLARRKPYKDKNDVEQKEGVLGYGGFGVVVPCLLRAANLVDEKNQKEEFYALKILAQLCNLTRPADLYTTYEYQEALMLKQVYINTNVWTRDRISNTTVDAEGADKKLVDVAELNSAWLNHNGVGNYKTYIPAIN